MRLVPRQEFLQLPAGTLYAQLHEPWVFSDLAVKGDTITREGQNIDFWYTGLAWIEADDPGMAFGRLDEMRADPQVSYPMEWAQARGSSYDDRDMFLVYEPADVERLIKLLEEGQ